MTDLIIGIVVLLLVGAAMAYIIKAKKSGVKCIGCSAGDGCAQKQKGAAGTGCSCGCHVDE